MGKFKRRIACGRLDDFYSAAKITGRAECGAAAAGRRVSREKVLRFGCRITENFATYSAI